MAANQYDERLDVVQIAFLALGAGLLVDGAHGLLKDSNEADAISFGIGSFFLALTWLRNLFHVWRKNLVQDPAMPATELDGGDFVVVWAFLFTAIGLPLGAAIDDRWYVGWVVAGIMVAVLLILRILLRQHLQGSRAPEGYALPIVALLGPVRVIFFAIGSYLVIRSLSTYADTGDNDAEITLLIAGLALLLLAFIEQGLIYRRRRTTAKPSELVAKIDGLAATLSRIEASVSAARRPDSQAQPRTSGTDTRGSGTPRPRPLWLVTFVTAALIGLGGYIAWQALQDANGEVAVAPLVLAGVTLVLATIGERLANLTFKLGKMEATASVTSTSAGAPAAEPGGTPSSGETKAKVGKVELDSTKPALVVSPEGEPVKQTLQRLLGGNEGRAFTLVDLPSDFMEEGEVVVSRSRVDPEPVKQKELKVKGPADDVKALLDELLH